MADNDSVIIKCPACGCDMVKVFMPKVGVNLDVCINGCGGIYFDNREFQEFDEPHEDISPLEELFKDKEFKSVDENQTRYCPVCGSAMMKNYSDPGKEVQVDECYSCGGKFLDYGEIKKIRSLNAPENKQNNAIIKDLYANVGMEILERKNRYNKISRKANKLSQVIFTLIMLFTIIIILFKVFIG